MQVAYRARTRGQTAALLTVAAGAAMTTTAWTPRKAHGEIAAGTQTLDFLTGNVKHHAPRGGATTEEHGQNGHLP